MALGEVTNSAQKLPASGVSVQPLTHRSTTACEAASRPRLENLHAKSKCFDKAVVRFAVQLHKQLSKHNRGSSTELQAR